MDFETTVKGFFEMMVPKPDPTVQKEPIVYQPPKPIKMSCPVAGQEMLITAIQGAHGGGVFIVQSTNGRQYRVEAKAKLSICNVPTGSMILERQFPKAETRADLPVNDSARRVVEKPVEAEKPQEPPLELQTLTQLIAKVEAKGLPIPVRPRKIDLIKLLTERQPEPVLEPVTDDSPPAS